jgi:hypothetical protein
MLNGTQMLNGSALTQFFSPKALMSPMRVAPRSGGTQMLNRSAGATLLGAEALFSCAPA